MKNTTFINIPLMDGRICSVFDIKAGHLFQANYEFSMDAQRGTLKTEITPYIWKQVIEIDGKRSTLEDIENLYLEDFHKIQQVLEAQSKKVDF